MNKLKLMAIIGGIILIGLTSCTYVPQKENRVDGVQVGNGMKGQTQTYYNDKYKIAMSYDSKVTYFTESSLEQVNFYTSAGSDSLAPHKLQVNVFPSGRLSKTGGTQIAAEKTVTDKASLIEVVHLRHPDEKYVLSEQNGSPVLSYSAVAGKTQTTNYYLLTSRGDVAWAQQQIHLDTQNITAQIQIFKSFRYEGSGPEFREIRISKQAVSLKEVNTLWLNLDDKNLGVKNKVAGVWRSRTPRPLNVRCSSTYHFSYDLNSAGIGLFSAAFIVPPNLCPGNYFLERVSVWNQLGNSGSLLLKTDHALTSFDSLLMSVYPESNSNFNRLPSLAGIRLAQSHSISNEVNAVIFELDREEAAPIEAMTFSAEFEGVSREGKSIPDAKFSFAGRPVRIGPKLCAVYFRISKFLLSGNYLLTRFNMSDWSEPKFTLRLAEGLNHYTNGFSSVKLAVFNPNPNLVDVVPPTVTGLYFSPADAELNQIQPQEMILKRGQRGMIVFEAEDLGSGIAEYLSLAGTLDRVPGVRPVEGNDTIPIFGAVRDLGYGRYSMDFFVPEDAASGYYAPRIFEIKDRQGNLASLKMKRALWEQLAKAGPQKTIQYSGPSKIPVPLLYIADE